MSSPWSQESGFQNSNWRMMASSHGPVAARPNCEVGCGSSGPDSRSAAGVWLSSRRRRCMDVAVAAGALSILWPFFVTAALLVRFTSAGPVLFRQRRMGRHGREFTLYKFRSMLVREECGPHVTVEGDARVTPIGAFLRRFKLDELPQFWNVLRGDMSLVGPRPKLPHHEGLHLLCRPGITGAATLAFRREEELLAGIPHHELDAFYEEYIKPEKARLDLEYITTATFRADVRLLWKTVACCLRSSPQQPVEEWRTHDLKIRADAICSDSVSAADEAA